MPDIHDLPIELLLLISGELVLKSLIAARGVCRLWRTSIDSAQISPTRRKLLDLYLKLIESPAFHATRDCILPHLTSFDREEFIAELPETTPEEFRTWILEWPARAVFMWVWPGLPGTCPRQPIFPDVTHHGDNNCLPDEPIQELRLFNPNSEGINASLWAFDCLPYKSGIWCGAARGRDELQVHVLPITSRVGPFFASQLEFYGIIVGSSLGTQEMNTVIHWNQMFNDAEETEGGWLEFLAQDFARQEEEVSDTP